MWLESTMVGLIAVSFVAHFAKPSLHSPLTQIQAQYHVAVDVLEHPFLWLESKYRIEAMAPSRRDLEKYVPLFSSEWRRYPASVSQKVRLKAIVLGLDFKLNGQARAAVPAFESAVMYYDTSLGANHPAYQRAVIHHEFFHMIDQRMGVLRRDPEWSALNPKGFSYGSGGVNMRTRGSGRYVEDVPGILTAYAASAVEEDKAELFAHLLTNRQYVLERAKKDPSLAAKVHLLKRRLKAWCPDLDEGFWASKPAAPLSQVDSFAWPETP